MPQLQTLTQLLEQLGSVATSSDPVGRLLATGFSLSPAIEAKIDATSSSIHLDAVQRRQLAESASRLGPVTFAAGSPLLPLADALPEGEYDVVAALRMSVLAETLAALFTGMTYPRELSEQDGIGHICTQERLATLSDDLPPGARIGPLRLTAPLQIAAIDGTDHVELIQPFSLDFRRTAPFGPGAPKEITVSSFAGTARFGLALLAKIVGDELVFSIENQVPVLEDDHLRITVLADSPIQPRSVQALGSFTSEIDDFFRTAVAIGISANIESISPTIRLPLGTTEATLTVHDTGVCTHRDDRGDVVVAGVRLGSEELPVEGLGDPTTLVNPLNSTEANVYIRMHEAFFRKLVKQAWASGALQSAASAVHPDLRVDGADAMFAANELKLVLNVRVVDVCGFPVKFIDVDATYTMTFQFSVFSEQIFVTQKTETDVSNMDIAACLLNGGLTLVVLGAVAILAEVALTYGRFGSLLSLNGDDGEPFDIYSAVFDPLVPIPGTELLPRVEVLQGLARPDRLEALGVLSLRPDDVNSYVYIQFLRRARQLGGAPVPVSNARVDIMDQDSPRPPGDDSAVVSNQSSTSKTGEVVTTRIVHFNAPTHDQVLASGRTDAFGRARFVITPAQLSSSAGTVNTTILTENLELDKFSRKVSEVVLTEANPDVYFRVSPADGPTFDTRKLQDGFMLNLRGGRVGTAAAPLVFVSGRSGPVVVGT